MWAVKALRSSSLIVCEAFEVPVPLTAILPPLASSSGPDDLELRSEVTSYIDG
jgi:hypothetical protein